jgi:hypothetical protein
MMKSALLKNAIPTERIFFRSGGDGIPILTKNSSQSTAGVKSYGLPSGNSAGGSANSTFLGSIRMGDDDGNGPASAIVGGPGEIFFPYRAPDRRFPNVMFESTGFNVYQPETLQAAAATSALLTAMGDRKFKATESAPFEQYFATQKLLKEANDASRGAGLEDLGHTREIMRSLVAERRKVNEDDFMRRMLDAGLSAADAQQEVDNVRKAAALQEVRRTDDRPYQAKLLIQRMAKARGVISSVNEPLTSSGAIENPQPSQRMADASGQPENGFGSSPLDRDRIFLTPDYYKRFLRRSTMTQEAGDEMAALATATAQATGPIPTPSMLRGIERENAIERSRDAVASRLDAASNRKRTMLPLPPVAEPFVDILRPAYRDKTPGSMGRFKDESIQDLSAFASFVALNQAIALEPAKLTLLKRVLANKQLTEKGRRGEDTEIPRRDIRELLRELTIEVVGTPELSIPFGGESRAIDDRTILNVLARIQGSSPGDIRAIQSEMRGYGALLEEAFQGLPAGAQLPEPIDTRTEARRAADEARAPRLVVAAPEARIGEDVGRAAPAVTGGQAMIGAAAGRAAPAEGGRATYTRAQLESMTEKQVQNLAGELGLGKGRKKALINKILGAQ